MNLIRSLSVFAFTLSAGLLACGLFMGRGFENQRELPVSISSEETLIVWNSKGETQDFIRKVVFNAKVPEFGLLVPVPAKPDVDEVSPSLFEILGDEMELQRPVETRWIFPWTQMLAGSVGELGSLDGAGSRGSKSLSAPGSAVQVIEDKKIGKFRAQVLTAQDTQALDAWLKEEGFALGSSSQSYLKHYIGGQWHWVVLTYKGEASDLESQSPKIESQVFRISFATSRPFYPYREPAPPGDSANPKTSSFNEPRVLRLYLLSDQEMDPSLETGEGAWPELRGGNETLFRSSVEHNRHKLQSQLPLLASMEKIFLQTFVETHYTHLGGSAARRQDSDLAFVPATTSRRILLPTIYKTIDTVPYFVLLILISGVVIVIWGLRRLFSRVNKR